MSINARQASGTGKSGGAPEDKKPARQLWGEPDAPAIGDWLRFSPDGKFLLFFTGNALSPTGNDLWILPLSGDAKPKPFVQTEFNETYGSFSPDGRWVAYTSAESGRNEIYVVPFPGPGGKWQISQSGGQYPRWRRDSGEPQ